MRRGFLSLIAIMDWASRKVLSWTLSNTLNEEFRLEALNEALNGPANFIGIEHLALNRAGDDFSGFLGCPIQQISLCGR